MELFRAQKHETAVVSTLHTALHMYLLVVSQNSERIYILWAILRALGTYPLLHAGDDEPEVRAHLLLVGVFLFLDALLETEKAKIKNLIICKSIFLLKMSIYKRL